MNLRDLTIADLFLACDFLKTLAKLDLATSQDRVDFQLAATTGTLSDESFRKYYSLLTRVQKELRQ